MNDALKKFSALFPLLGFTLFLLSSCSDLSSKQTITVAKTKGYQPHHGPFDKNGNYVEAWADNPPRRIYVDPADLKDGKKEQVAYAPEPVAEEPVIAYTPPVRQSTSNTTYKPKKKKTTPKKKAVKVKPKRKPPIIHTVKKGDTLYGLARRYKSSVETIMSANNLKSTTIRIGQKVKIPRF